MKNILVIDDSPLFREYLWTKCTENALDLTMSSTVRDGLAKMRTLKPDLVLLDYHISGLSYLEVLQQKKDNAGIADIPLIITAKRLDQDKIIELAPYNISKVFTKPIQIDALFGAIAQILNVRFDLDTAPGRVDVHINDNIIFIEISQGLNQDKLELLQFKMLELIELYRVRSPRLLVMISHTKLGPADTPKLYSLFEIVTKIAAGGQQNIRVLTRDSYVSAYLASRREFSGIQIEENLSAAVEQLLGEAASGEPAAIEGRLLSRPDQTGVGESVQLTFAAEDGPPVTLENIRDMLQNLKIAVVDDDFVIQELIKNTFQRAGAIVSTFPDGGAYLAALESVPFDLTFLDMIMPAMDGFAVLQAMQEKEIRQPVIVLSALSQRESVIRAFKLGIKSYLVKPLRPGAIFTKTLEILRTTF